MEGPLTVGQFWALVDLAEEVGLDLTYSNQVYTLKAEDKPVVSSPDTVEIALFVAGAKWAKECESVAAN
jgi:hypothetical protein